MAYCEKCGAKIKAGSNFCEGCGKSFKKVESQGKTSKQRPTFLNVWLILMIIGNAFALIGASVMPLIIPIVIVNFILIWALYNWKKWGFYGYIGTGIIGLFLNASLYGGTGVAISLIGLIVGVLILYFAMKPVWNHFE